ncbi:dihydroorotate dehydrogenase electron transfer subunit [Syntrophomonas palmitatica]|uniref:dihydroorotate dehydrogenase electron transfer subunit n=1 Tax=Syntrophomonas palmitatica TaxID=402877 RepID=UPI0006D02A39|nr:dihydroorotate dehydrogenase electron transfer subunit [Syntrophomonas palmitatica]
MPFLEQGLVVRHTQLTRDMWELEFIAPSIAPDCRPGQFVHIRSSLDNSPLLRRPLSLFDVDKKLGSITLLYKVVGKGTNLLTRIRTKEYLDAMGPLGRGFSLAAPRKKVILVGGGVGIAPLFYLARALVDNNCKVTVLHGVECRRQLVALQKLRDMGVEFMPSTIDGSAGYKGLVTDLLVKKMNPQEIDYIYACGPEPMMAAVCEYAKVWGIPGEVSLEEYMACGVGACLGCARKLKPKDENYIKVCKDGPVFSMSAVELQK